MSSARMRDRWELRLRDLSPVIALATVLGSRAVLGGFVGHPMHPVTIVAATAGTLGATLIVFSTQSTFDPGDSSTERFLRRVWGGLEETQYKQLADWLILFGGALAGGIYPTVFHAGLELPGEFITHLYPAFATAILWGVTLFLASFTLYLTTGALSLSRDSIAEIRTFSSFYAVYTAFFASVIGYSRLLWFPLFELF